MPNEVYSYLENSAVADVSWLVGIYGVRKTFRLWFSFIKSSQAVCSKISALFSALETQATKLKWENKRGFGLMMLWIKCNSWNSPNLLPVIIIWQPARLSASRTPFQSGYRKTTARLRQWKWRPLRSLTLPIRELKIVKIGDSRCFPISADSRKSLVEKNYKSKFREISMTNAVEFFVMLY